MKFVKTDDLEKGMRLARPVYNKNGVLLYDRDTKLTRQGINSIKNFGIIGIYILEPTEPLPPMTEEDIEFERFQTMSVFGLREDIGLLTGGNKPVNLENMVRMISRKYGTKTCKISTVQNLRSKEDGVYKHGLFVAILGAAMGARLKLAETEIDDVVAAGLISGAGLQNIRSSEFITDNVKYLIECLTLLKDGESLGNADVRKQRQARILFAADVYDDMTAMQPGKEPVSEVAAVKYLLNNVDKFDDIIVGSLVDSMRMLYPGICVELTNKATGIVILGNEDNVLRPIILGFGSNKVYNLLSDAVYSEVQISDIMKTMDRRVHIDPNTINEYMERYSGK